MINAEGLKTPALPDLKLPNLKKGAVFFDLDGTFIDTAPDFAHVLNELRAEQHLSPLPYQIIRDTVSNGARALITLAFNLNEGEVGFEDLKAKLLKKYTSHLAVKSRPFDGIMTLIEQLEAQHIPWGIITNKPSQFTIPLMQQLNLHDRAAAIVCPDQVKNTKPDPEPMFLACKLSNVEAKHCIYVGDHDRDIQAGRAANMLTVACRFGYVGDEILEDWKADLIIDHPDELTQLIKQNLASYWAAGNIVGYLFQKTPQVHPCRLGIAIHGNDTSYTNIQQCILEIQIPTIIAD